MNTIPSAWLVCASLPWCWLLPSLPAQEGGSGLPPGARIVKKGDDPQKLKQSYEQKRANPVFTLLPWQFDFAAAQQQAKAEHKLIFGYFTRSWARCEPCEEFEQEVLTTPGFKAFAAKVVPFVHITTHLADMADDDLLTVIGGNATPTLAFLDESGAPLRRMVGDVDLAAIEAAFTSLQRWQQLRAAVAAGQRDQEKALFLLELEMGNRSFAEMQQRHERLQFDAAEQKLVEQQLINLEFLQILKATPLQKLGEAGGKYVAMYRAHRIPDTAQDTSFWLGAFTYAALQGDLKLYEEMLQTLRQTKAKDERLQLYLPRLEQQLETLRANAKKR